MAQASRHAWLMFLGEKLTNHRLPALEGQMAVVSLAPDLQNGALVLRSLLGSTWQYSSSRRTCCHCLTLPWKAGFSATARTTSRLSFPDLVVMLR